MIFNFSLDEKNMQVIFEDNIYFSGNYIFKNLEKSEQLVVAILTLGSKTEKMSADFFSQGDYLMGMIYDAIGSVGLNDLKKGFFEKLCERARHAKSGITRVFSPGSGGWGIEDQDIIFKLLDAKSIGVTLKSSMMMTPVKSLVLSME